jgi:hypothetical protein
VALTRFPRRRLETRFLAVVVEGPGLVAHGRRKKQLAFDLLPLAEQTFIHFLAHACKASTQRERLL